MTLDKDTLIAKLVNQALDGNMDQLNACEDKMVRAKAKALLMKIKKGKAERPPNPSDETKENKAVSDSFNIESLSKDELISYLVNKGLDGDMDSINAFDDKMIRAKVKAMIVKVNKGTIDRPVMPDVASSDIENIIDNDQNDKSSNDINQKVRKMIEENFEDSLGQGDDSFIYLKSDKWYEIATWLKSEESLMFDSLQCQMGVDIGDGNLESRYNLHSMVHDHYIEVRIIVPRSNAKVPSVEKIWRIADWFERETYDMLGIEYTGHRDLRRILLPDDWEGWPLRKDYVVQETYHGIVVPKVKEGWE